MALQFNIWDLLRERPNTMVCLTSEDLGLFARQLLADAEKEYERRKEAEARNTEEFLSAEDVKAIIGVSDSTLYRFNKAGILPAIWIGGQRRYRRSDLDAYINK